MKVKKAHCFFEQSGTFKNEFKKLGIPAEDYDLQNNFGETDNIVDLFEQINLSYSGEKSIFDSIESDDLIVSFFPCTFFSCLSSFWFDWNYKGTKNFTDHERIEFILKRNRDRAFYLSNLYKLIYVCKCIQTKLIIENPWSEQHFLKFGFWKKPTLIYNDRTMYGDFFKKPTAFWFFNCHPTNLNTIQFSEIKKRVLDCKQGVRAGICSEERSMISPDFARNFICDKIIGKKQEIGQCSLF